jgi:hypothetical protein
MQLPHRCNGRSAHLPACVPEPRAHDTAVDRARCCSGASHVEREAEGNTNIDGKGGASAW